MTDEQKFMTMLNTLARAANFELDVELIGVYDRHLAPHGYLKVSKTLENIFVERNSRDPFPSIAEILRNMGVTIGDKTLADDVCARMCSAMKRHGYTWPHGTTRGDLKKWKAFKILGESREELYCPTHKEAIIIECGELGYAVFEKMGGYAAVCAEWGHTKNPQVYRSQLREICRSVIELANAGRLYEAPKLPVPNKVESLTNNVIKSLTVENDS